MLVGFEGRIHPWWDDRCMKSELPLEPAMRDFQQIPFDCSSYKVSYKNRLHASESRLLFVLSFRCDQYTSFSISAELYPPPPQSVKHFFE